jgi:uncharacterized protein YbjT (DUF2867 family)
MSKCVLVTGASGNVGKEVVAALHDKYPDITTRLATRKKQSVSKYETNTETVHLNFRNPDSFSPALQNCSSVFLLRPPDISNTPDTLNKFITSARQADIKQIVFLSVAGAADFILVPHHAVEQQLRRGSDDWTILRAGFFAQNLATAYKEDINQDDRLYLPAGNGEVAFVDLRDVGQVAAHALVTPSEHAGMTYTLTGSKTYTFEEVAQLLSEHVGRMINYDQASVLGYLYHVITRKKLGFLQSLVQTVLHTGLRFGQAKKVDPTLAELLNRKPYDLEDYIRDHKDIWT